MYLESNDINTLLDLIQEQPDSSNDNNDRDSYFGTGEKLVGDIIKVGNLPVGKYYLTAIRRYKNTYGIQHLVQVNIPEENKFKAIVSFQDEDTSSWVTEEKEIVGNVILKANSKLNKLLLSDPVVSTENPGVLTVLEKGEYNGYPTSKITFDCSEYTVDNELLDINF